MPDSHITPQMLDLIGLELRSATSFPITDSDIRRWAIAVSYPEPAPRLFWDADYAAGTAADAGVVARAAGGFVGPEETLGLPAPATTAIINGGTEVEYGVRMRPGDVITSSTTLSEYKEREGRLGLMLFTTTKDTWTNQRGETVKTSRNTLIRY